MKSIGIIFTALGVYALAVACVLWPGNASGGAGGETSITPDVPMVEKALDARAVMQGLPYRTCGMQIQRTDWMDKYKQSVDEIAAVGADTVKFVVDARQENGASAKIYLDLRMTPTVETLGDLIQHAHKKGLRVILMPIVLLDAPRGNEWRGQISPSQDNGGWNTWWESYRDMLGHFAWIAQANHVDVLVIGSELVSTEPNVKEWTKTIQHVRKIFKGKLTYSSNWDHYTSVPFWNQLDLIGMNSYWKMTDGRKTGDEVTLDEIKQHWKKIQSDLLPFIQKTGKPLMFLEIGWFSQRNVAYEPWDYTKPVDEEPIDLQLQKRLYEGFFESWYGNPLLGGFSIWEWTPGDGGPNDPGYTPENKPAEDVLKQWFAKPRWEVK